MEKKENWFTLFVASNLDCDVATANKVQELIDDDNAIDYSEASEAMMLKEIKYYHKQLLGAK
jgi:hypothetical protein